MTWQQMGIGAQYRPQRRVRTALSFAAIPLVGYLHYLAGMEIEFHPLFLLPIIAATWYGGASAGLLASLSSITVWLLTDWLLLGESTSGVMIFNHGVRFSVFLIVMTLVAQYKGAFERARLLALTDPLTGLANRRAFHERCALELTRAHRYGHPVAALLFDLDDFKSVNDTQGHGAGDKLLCAVAEVLRNRCRAADICARLGGDEFAVLLPETDAKAVQVFAEKLQQHLLDAMQRKGWPVTFSLGAVAYSHPPDDVEQLVSHADAMMYSVKHSSKDNIRIEVL